MKYNYLVSYFMTGNSFGHSTVEINRKITGEDIGPIMEHIADVNDARKTDIVILNIIALEKPRRKS